MKLSLQKSFVLYREYIPSSSPYLKPGITSGPDRLRCGLRHPRVSSGFANSQASTFELRAIEAFSRCLSFRLLRHFHKSEAARVSRRPLLPAAKGRRTPSSVSSKVAGAKLDCLLGDSQGETLEVINRLFLK